MQYRREIDGLRAVAVLPVILFHAGFGAFAGGYVGVDVFFVISGYLITTIILAELEAGRFSLARFYERRARRILPALFLVMAVCLPFAWAWMVPQQFESFSRALVAVSLFVSNILFWRTTGYFEPRAEENPLLHTWSLAIEEQFYIGFPLLLLALWRLGRNPVLAAVLGLSALSLLLAEWGWRNHPEANFYLLPTRAWELGVGALCAFVLQGRLPGAGPVREHALLSALGLGLIVLAVFRFDGETPFPSLYTLVPVLGAALVILHGGPSTPAGRLLSTPLLVGIGLISYSAYLWHQPLFAFARIRSPSHPGPELMLALTLASLALAYLSWRMVELPFRRKPVPALPARRAVFAAAGAGVGLFLAVGLYGALSEGRRALWVAQNPERAQIYALHEEAWAISGVLLDDGACRFNLRFWDAAGMERAKACARTHGPGIAVLGDSHAVDLFNGFYANAPHPFIVGITSNCRPYTPRAECPYDRLLDWLAANPGTFGQVIYTQAGYFLIEAADGSEGRDIFERIPETNPMDPEGYAGRAQRIAQVAAYLDRLAAHAAVVWLGPRIEPHISRNFILSRGCDFAYDLRPGQAEIFANLDAEIAAAVAPHAFAYVSQIKKVGLDMSRDFGTCEALYWRDGDHWSLAGAELFVARLLARAPHLGRPEGRTARQGG